MQKLGGTKALVFLLWQKCWGDTSPNALRLYYAGKNVGGTLMLWSPTPTS